jgi:hypothetical protein
VESSDKPVAKLETNAVVRNPVLNGLAPVEMACQEATWLGRAFLNNFLRLKRLVQDQSTYRMQLDVFTAFVAELLLADRAVVALEELIEWRDE